MSQRVPASMSTRQIPLRPDGGPPQLAGRTSQFGEAGVLQIPRYALKQVDSAHPTVFTPELRRSKYKGITGEISFNQHGDLSRATSTL